MKPRTSFVQQRYVLAVMGLFGIMTVYLTRLNLSIAIVAMVGHDSTLLKSSNNHTVSTCPAPFGT